MAQGETLYGVFHKLQSAWLSKQDNRENISSVSVEAQKGWTGQNDDLRTRIDEEMLSESFRPFGAASTNCRPPMTWASYVRNSPKPAKHFPANLICSTNRAVITYWSQENLRGGFLSIPVFPSKFNPWFFTLHSLSRVFLCWQHYNIALFLPSTIHKLLSLTGFSLSITHRCDAHFVSSMLNSSLSLTCSSP